MAAKSRKALVGAAAAIAVALLGAGLFAVTTSTQATPIFTTGGPAQDQMAFTSVWQGAYNWAYEEWLPSNPGAAHNLTTISAWLFRPDGRTTGQFGLGVYGGGIDETTCTNSDGIRGNGCYWYYPVTQIGQTGVPVNVTFDVSGFNWVRKASSSPTFIEFWTVDGLGLEQWWAPSSSRGSGHCGVHAGNCYVLHSPNGPAGGTDYYDQAISVYESLTASAPLTADFTASSSGLTASFTSSVAGGTPPYSYDWDFGDGTCGGIIPVCNGNHTSRAANPTFTYASAGTYTVTLSVSDSGFQSASKARTVTVSTTAQPLKVDFTYTVDADGVTARFTSSVSGGLQPYAYAWDFGDGSSSTAADPVHAYAASGSYSAKLSVTDTKPQTVSASHTVVTNAPAPPPSASFSYTTNYLSVSFVGSASGGTPPYTYSWDFGDGGTSSSGSIAHTYLGDGVYSVVFVVTDSKGLSGSQTRAVTVASKPPTPEPLSSADFTSEALPNSTASFTSTVKGGNGTLTYSWSFGDGATSSMSDPTHQFPGPGTYTVNLTVRDASGSTASAEHSVTVSAAPGPAVPWVQILGILLAAGGAVLAALMLEFERIRSLRFVLASVVLIVLGAMLIAGLF